MWVRGRCRPAGGFTLIEILVVVLLIGIATTASLNYLRPPQPDAAREGQRLAGLFERLALEARLSGQRMSWRCAGQSLVFATWRSAGVAGEGSWQSWPPLPGATLPVGLQLGALTVNGRAAECVRPVVFPAFGSAPEFTLEVLAADAAGSFTRRVLSGDVAGQVRLLGDLQN